ncbi:MAG: Nif11-like leader peptide family natural product precursor [Deltaproteobacteria bacterium]|nr:Nif11-like leader peptide family natural product precursor [Deltaproteobacteria bacterium]
MTTEQAREFHQRVIGKVELRAKLAALQGQGAGFEAVLALARDEGLEFTLDELRAVTRQLEAGDRPVPDEELDSVAGGVVDFWMKLPPGWIQAYTGLEASGPRPR